MSHEEGPKPETEKARLIKGVMRQMAGMLILMQEGGKSREEFVEAAKDEIEALANTLYYGKSH